jgi:hypothetical protein
VKNKEQRMPETIQHTINYTLEKLKQIVKPSAYEDLPIRDTFTGLLPKHGANAPMTRRAGKSIIFQITDMTTGRII